MMMMTVMAGLVIIVYGHLINIKNKKILENPIVICKNCTIKFCKGVCITMGRFITLNKCIKQIGVLYADLFKEIIKMVKVNTSKVVKSVFVGIGAFALCVVLAGAVFFVMGTYNKYIFTVDNWNEHTSDRIDMVKSMESQYDFLGMSQSQIEGILGKPSYSTLKHECEYVALKDMEYDFVLQYELNKNSKSIVDMIDKNYVIAFKADKVVYAKTLIAD